MKNPYMLGPHCLVTLIGMFAHQAATSSHSHSTDSPIADIQVALSGVHTDGGYGVEGRRGGA
jgi:hypothetical protein